MKRTENIAVKIALGTGVLALLSSLLIAGAALGIVKGLMAEDQLGVICYVLHFLCAYVGCLICCTMSKERKGLAVGGSLAVWYILLLFAAIVLLDCSPRHIPGSVGAGAAGYGAALLTCLAPKRRKNKRVKFPSR